MDQEYLNFYFNKIWKPGFNSFTKTGFQLLDRIKPDDWVLDVGCGYNPFKGKIVNLVGIDPANDAADIKTTIEEFAADRQFDVAFCLGSINFGDVSVIESQIEKVSNCLTPQGRIFWRCNPGRKDHGNAECENIDFYDWSFAEHIRLADKFKFKILELSWDNNRIYAEWIKLPQ